MATTAAEVSLSTGAGRVLLLGATLGAFMDGFHTYGGATSYPHPFALKMAWWTPPLFAGAYLLLALTYRLFEGRGDGGESLQPARAGLAAAIFTALYFASGFLPASSAVKLAVLLVGALVLASAFDRSRAAIVTGLIAAVVGPTFEVTLVHFGAFSHLQPDFFGIPMWLPALYLASGPGLGALLSLGLGRFRQATPLLGGARRADAT